MKWSFTHKKFNEKSRECYNNKLQQDEEKKQTKSNTCKINDSANEIMVLITKATREDSGKPAHPRSLARTFAVRTSMKVDEGSDQTSDI